jgi:glycine/D-amino acid oxidase-like deaminating enzyme
MHVDYIIVGRGIAGTVLAYTLLGRGCTVALPEGVPSPSASEVAAGIVNPVTGKRLSKTWRAEDLFGFLAPFYRQLEAALGEHFFHEVPVYRLFGSNEEQNTWMGRMASPEYGRFIRSAGRLYPDQLQQPFGGMEITEAGYVDIPRLLASFGRWFREKGIYRPGRLQAEELTFRAGQVTWRDLTARKIIFCEGAFGRENPYFNWLPFRPVKGELLTVQIPGAAFRHIINQHLFIMPTGEEDTYRVGATYEWKDLSWEPTGAAAGEIAERLQKLLKVPFRVTGQQAGIRPATADRRPFLGLHPERPEAAVFNGLGTKGVSLAPYFAEQFAEHLLNDKELDSQVHISRYNSLYYLSQ